MSVSEAGIFQAPGKTVRKDVSMTTMTQKKITISPAQKQFLEDYRRWGFTDQSSIVREALSRFIGEFEKNRRKSKMAQKAHELLSDYTTDTELTTFTDLDGDDFL